MFFSWAIPPAVLWSRLWGNQSPSLDRTQPVVFSCRANSDWGMCMCYTVLQLTICVLDCWSSVIKKPTLNINIFSMFLKICCSHFRVYLKTRFIGYLTCTFSVEIISMFDMYMYFQCDSGIEGLKSIAVIMRDSDVSPFEIIHSGLIQKLLQYLTSSACAVPRDVRIRRFLHIFLNCPVSS